MSHFDAELEADLLKLDFQSMYVKWGSNSPARTGMHASAVLAKDSEWCTREQVLHELFPEQGEPAAWNHWDWKKSAIFENGWDLHRRWQRIFLKFGNVVWSPESGPGIAYIPSIELSRIGKEIDGKIYVPELDLTHFDVERNLYFSPDAIIQFGGTRYVVEIKGIKEQSYLELTDDLETACRANETVHKAREQVNLYMHLLGLSRGIILVENKNTCDFKLWVIEYDQERAWKYTNRINEVKGRTILVKSQGMSKLPERVCKSANDPRAKKCPMRQACFIQKGEDW